MYDQLCLQTEHEIAGWIDYKVMVLVQSKSDFAFGNFEVGDARGA